MTESEMNDVEWARPENRRRYGPLWFYRSETDTRLWVPKPKP
jgi:hypothetical protein